MYTAPTLTRLGSVAELTLRPIEGVNKSSAQVEDVLGATFPNLGIGLGSLTVDPQSGG